MLESDAVERLGILREERGLLVPAEAGDDLGVGIHQLVIGALQPVHRPVRGEEAAFHAERLNGCKHVGPDAVYRPIVVGHAEAGDLPADVVAGGCDGSSRLYLAGGEVSAIKTAQGGAGGEVTAHAMHPAAGRC